MHFCRQTVVIIRWHTLICGMKSEKVIANTGDYRLAFGCGNFVIIVCKSVVCDFGGPNPPAPTRISSDFSGDIFFAQI